MRRRGAALAEVLLAILLLALMVGSVFDLLPVSLLTGERASHRQEAQALADSCLEQLRAQSWSGLVPHSQVRKEKVGLIDCELTEEVFIIEGHDPQYLLGLRSRVRWRDRTGSAEVESEVWVSCVRP